MEQVQFFKYNLRLIGALHTNCNLCRVRLLDGSIDGLSGLQTLRRRGGHAFSGHAFRLQVMNPQMELARSTAS